MGKLIDLTGQRFGRLVVIERAGTDGSYPTWLCKCDCGNSIITRGCHLRRGDTQSCGCIHTETFTHKKHGEKRSRLYSIWRGMKTRCYNKNFESYRHYGGRGITICKEWLHSFEAFRDWALAHGYRDDLTIDRIDNDKGYCPDNCRWATMKEQQNNRSNNKSK